MTPPLSATVNWTPTNVRFWPKAVIRWIPGGHGLLPLYWPDGVGQQLISTIPIGSNLGCYHFATTLSQSSMPGGI